MQQKYQGVPPCEMHMHLPTPLAYNWYPYGQIHSIAKPTTFNSTIHQTLINPVKHFCYVALIYVCNHPKYHNKIECFLFNVIKTPTYTFQL